MQIRNKNLKQQSVTVVVNDSDDIWLLYRIIQPQDQVSGMTERKIKSPAATTEKAGTAQIKRMNLSITVEKTSYDTDGKSLRVLGPIVDGNEFVSAGEYHSFIVQEQTEITITKEHWRADELRAIEESALGKKGSTIVIAFDRSSATIGTLSKKGFVKNLSLEGSVQKKGIETTVGKISFYEEILAKVVEMDSRIQATVVIAASSNFWRDPFLKTAETHAKELRKKIKWIECEDTTEQAIHQLTKTPEFQQLTLGKTQSENYNLFEEILQRIATNGAATYGFDAVLDATQKGAVHTALISQSLFSTHRENGTFDRLQDLLKQIEEQGATIHIIGDEYSFYNKLDGLGGIIALLRFKSE